MTLVFLLIITFRENTKKGAIVILESSFKKWDCVATCKDQNLCARFHSNSLHVNVTCEVAISAMSLLRDSIKDLESVREL